MPQIGKQAINGTDYEVHAAYSSNGGVYFRVVQRDEDEEVTLGSSGDSARAAIAAARKLLNERRVKVRVPFKLMDGRTAYATGINLRTREVVAEDEDGRPVVLNPLDRFDSLTTFRADTPLEKLKRADEIEALQAALQEEYREIRGTYEHGGYVGRGGERNPTLVELVERAQAEAAEREAAVAP